MWTRMSRKGGILIYFLFFTILTPPSLVLVKDKFIRIVVDADKAWLLRPEIIYDTVSMGNIHHFIVELKPGKNYITVYYEKEGKTESQNLTVYSYPSEDFKVNAKLYKFHGTKREKVCKECHSIEYTSVSKKEDLDCYTCHREKFKTGINYHPPFEELSCDNCHDKIFNRPKTPDVCQTCHDVEIGFYLHSPYAKGECYICHDPHSSTEDKFLRDKVNNLCYLCHEKESYGKHHPVAMHPGEKKGVFCNKCHSPHGTRYGFHLRWPNKPVCVVCHKK